MIGRGVTVGRPLGLLLTRKSENATVTLCHTGTRDIAAHARAADIVVAAAGVPAPDHRRPREARRRGARRRHHPHRRRAWSATSHPDVREVAGFLAPMPGGVGPMTRAMLLANVVEAAERSGPTSLRRARPPVGAIRSARGRRTFTADRVEEDAALARRSAASGWARGSSGRWSLVLVGPAGLPGRRGRRPLPPRLGAVRGVRRPGLLPAAVPSRAGCGVAGRARPGRSTCCAWASSGSGLSVFALDRAAAVVAVGSAPVAGAEPAAHRRAPRCPGE